VDVEECRASEDCRNAEKRCYACDGKRLFKPYKTMTGLRRKPSRDKQGMSFEEKGVQLYNEHARRMPNSGGFEGFEGDVETVLSLLEFKEREGNELKGGKKSITLRKEWLEKISGEAEIKGKIPGLAFRFKDDGENIYVAVDYDDLMELLLTIVNQKKEIERLHNR